MNFIKNTPSLVTSDTCVLGDCLQVMKHIPDNYVDSIICDPPYGTTAI